MKRIAVTALALAFSAGASASDISPRIGLIEIYGAHHVSTQKIRSVLGVTEGGLLPSSKGDVEGKLDELSGVVDSRLEANCCLDGKLVLYVGIQERDSPHFEFHAAPEGNDVLPPEITSQYDAFLDNVNQSIRLNETGEDLTRGYSLMVHPGARRIQEAFLPLAAEHLDSLHKVLRDASDPEQRAIAAYVLQYGPRKPRTTPQIANDLQYALQDPDDRVRKNAMRSLTALLVGERLHPEQEVKIQPTWFVELLNSVVWSDRHNASLALVNLTEDRNPDTLAMLRERALRAVIEMANWQDLTNALPPFILAGRLAGLSEKDIQHAWVTGDRDMVLKLAAKPPKDK